MFFVLTSTILLPINSKKNKKTFQNHINKLDYVYHKKYIETIVCLAIYLIMDTFTIKD